MSIDKHFLASSLSRFCNARVAVLGDFCLDIYWHADMRKSELSRETPHFPLPIVQERLNPGGAGNVTANLLALEPKSVSCLGIFGTDWRGDALKKLLIERGADVSGIVTDSTRQTDTYIKPLRRGISDVVYEDPRLDFTNYSTLSPETEAKLIEELEKLSGKIDVLCVSDQMPFGCVSTAIREKIIELCGKGLTAIVDSRDRIGLYRNVIVKPNDIEAARALGVTGSPDIESLKKMSAQLSARTGRPAIITAGENGCIVYENGEAVHIPAFDVTGEIDFCGAGDTFLSGVACATAAGFSLAEAATIACAASAVTIKKLKTTGTANRAELAERLVRA